MNTNARGIGAVKILFILASLAVCSALGVSYFLFSGKSDGDAVEIVVERGKSAAAVTDLLEANGVIKGKFFFRTILRLTQADKKLRAGEFRFRREMRAIDALTALYKGDMILHPVTIPEGWRITQIAGALAANKLIDEKKFLALALSKDSASRFGFKTPTLEGFLFPTTYQLSRVDGEERILEQMVNQFKQIYEKNFRQEAEKKVFTVENVVTMASIIERETGVSDERPMVSSVFHNRLKKKMRLQSDPTTIYGIENFNGNLTKMDLKKYSPYNTYVIFGLPPGPIASPGEASLRASLNPVESENLYFVAKSEGGGHIFSKSYGAHTRNVTNTQVLPNRKGPKKKR